jgi:AraC-like DNA-binding protein
MSSAPNTVYEEWKLELPSMPPRSTLYSLEPVGLGTPEVECLTSYITRLAEAHCVFPGILMYNLVGPFLQHSSVTQVSRESMAVGQARHTESFNGTAQKRAGAAVYALECLTLQRSLRFLTLLTWEGAFPAHKLLRQTRAWCPACLEEWKRTGQVIYEPLLWTLQVVTRCVRHQCKLCITCPHPECGRSAPWIAWKSRPGHCPFCRGWLRMAVPASDGGDEAEMAWQQWATEQLGNLFALAPTVVAPPPRTRIHEVLRRALQHMGPERPGRHNEFARSLGVVRATYSTWLSRQIIPPLETLLSICARWNISLYECLFEDVSALVLHAELGVSGPRKGKHQQNGKGSWGTPQIREALEAILTNEEFPPPSLGAVARRLGCSPASLLQHHKEVCNALTKRYQAYLQTKKQTDLQHYCEEVRQAARHIASQGMRPNANQLGKVLKKPGILRSSEIREAWQEVLREFDSYR